MMNKIILALALLVSDSTAFVQLHGFSQSSRTMGPRFSSETAAEVKEPVSDVVEPVPEVSTPIVPPGPSPINGWVPDENAFCYGLPGALPPMGDFDPIGFARKGTPLNDIRRNREAEVMHGRVAMLASVGYLAGEAFSPVVWGGAVSGPANDQLAQIPGPLFAFLTLFIGIAETYRATRGWVEPTTGQLWTLRDTYYPGDLGFDPLGLKPTNAKDFANMQTKELQNGRLAMLGVAGMCSQELVNHKTIMETYDFYQKVYSGINPYTGEMMPTDVL